MLERLRWNPGQLGEEPEHGRPTGLGNRQVEDAELRQHHCPQLHVLGEPKVRSVRVDLPGTVLFESCGRSLRLHRLDAFGHADVAVAGTETSVRNASDRTAPVCRVSCLR